MSLLAFALSLGLASPVQRIPFEPAIARAIDAALVDQQAPLTDWSSVAVRLAPHVNLHEAEPSNEDWRNWDKAVFRRSGWISQAGDTAGLALCGDEDEVHAVSVSTRHLRAPEGGILPALAALGIRAVETDRQGPVMPERADEYDRSLRAGRPDRIVWAVQKPGHVDAALVGDHVCTPPGTRSAPQCWMRFTVQLRPADPTPMECPLLGRWGV